MYTEASQRQMIKRGPQKRKLEYSAHTVRSEDRTPRELVRRGSASPLTHCHHSELAMTGIGGE